MRIFMLFVFVSFLNSQLAKADLDYVPGLFCFGEKMAFKLSEPDILFEEDESTLELRIGVGSGKDGYWILAYSDKLVDQPVDLMAFIKGAPVHRFFGFSGHKKVKTVKSVEMTPVVESIDDEQSVRLAMKINFPDDSSLEDQVTCD